MSPSDSCAAAAVRHVRVVQRPGKAGEKGVCRLRTLPQGQERNSQIDPQAVVLRCTDIGKDAKLLFYNLFLESA